MSTKTKNIFFLGKGGVGKSTCSALTALYLSGQGYKTALISMDPAHNQSDIFEKIFSDKFLRINKNLYVKEIDTAKWVNNYLNTIQQQVKRTYSYLTAFNLEHYLDILKFSPGLEEYALLLAYRDIRKNSDNIDYIIFDMPPTALTLKFLTLPDISIKWLENLLELRNKILEKKEIIARVKFGKKEIETDKIHNNLKKQIDEYKSIKKEFSDNKITILNLVMNADKLSYTESQLIIDKLDSFGIFITNIFLNKLKQDSDYSEIMEKTKKYGFQVLPKSKYPLIGTHSLINYLNEIKEINVF